MFTTLNDVKNSFDSYTPAIPHTAIPGEVEWLDSVIDFCAEQVNITGEAMEHYHGPRTEVAYEEAMRHRRRTTLADLCAELGMASTGYVLADIDAVQRSIQSKEYELAIAGDITSSITYGLDSPAFREASETRSYLRNEIDKFQDVLNTMLEMRSLMQRSPRQQFAAGSPFYLLQMSHRGAKEQYNLALAYKASI